MSLSTVDLKLTSRQVHAAEVAMGVTPEKFVSVPEVSDWHQTPMPEVTSSFSAAISWEEFQRAVAEHGAAFGSMDDSFISIARTLALYTGIAPMDDAAAKHFVFDPGHSPAEGFPSVRLNMLEKRPATFRGVPLSWSDHLRTPVVASDAGDEHIMLSFRDLDGTMHELGRTPTLRPMTLYPLAYRNSRADGSLTINPRQDCTMRCRFCRRGYHRLQESHFATFSAEQMAAFIEEKYPTYNFAQIRIVTGAFMNFEHMRSFIETLVSELARMSDGVFDPRVHEAQSIYTLTHLARTEEQMRALREVGVKGVEDSVEIFDDERRRVIMPKANEASRAVGKGDQPFEELLPAVEAGVRVFGKRYSWAVVVGLDDYATTITGFRALHEVGLQSVTSALFVPYGLDEVSLQLMTFPEALAARRFVRANFLRAF